MGSRAHSSTRRSWLGDAKFASMGIRLWAWLHPRQETRAQDAGESQSHAAAKAHTASAENEAQISAAIAIQRNVRMVGAQRERHRLYWEYAFGLLREDAVVRIQRRVRIWRAQKEARSQLALLREWDTLLLELKFTRQTNEIQQAQRMQAAKVLQRGWRHMVAKRTRQSQVSRRFLFFSQAEVQAERAGALNPFSETWVGQSEHRRRVESEIGTRLRAYGAPKRGASERALPSQINTLLNVLRFVDAINALLLRGHVRSVRSDLTKGSALAITGKLPTATRLPHPAHAAAVVAPGAAGLCEIGAPTALYTDLMGWGRMALQTRFGGAAQYMKSAKRFGLLHFEGELGELIVRGGRVASCSVGSSRSDMLHACLRRPLLVVPGLAGTSDPVAKLKRKLDNPPYRALIEQFLCGSFDTDGIRMDSVSPAWRRPQEAALSFETDSDAESDENISHEEEASFLMLNPTKESLSA